jgi:hypothetical protein
MISFLLLNLTVFFIYVLLRGQASGMSELCPVLTVVKEKISNLL